MSTVEHEAPVSEENFLGVSDVERAGVGTGFLVLSNQIDFVGIYTGPAMSTIGFRGLMIEHYRGYKSAIANGEPTSKIRIGHDFHREGQVDGVMPLAAFEGLHLPTDTEPAEFTRIMLGQVIAAGKSLLENPELPRRLDDGDLAKRIELYETVRASLDSGEIVINQDDGSINISSLGLFET